MSDDIYEVKPNPERDAKVVKFFEHLNAATELLPVDMKGLAFTEIAVGIMGVGRPRWTKANLFAVVELLDSLRTKAGLLRLIAAGEIIGEKPDENVDARFRITSQGKRRHEERGKDGP